MHIGGVLVAVLYPGHGAGHCVWCLVLSLGVLLWLHYGEWTGLHVVGQHVVLRVDLAVFVYCDSAVHPMDCVSDFGGCL